MENQLQEPENIYVIKAYKCAQLCQMYEVSKKTFIKWIKPFEDAIGPRYGHYFTIAQVRIIFDKLGFPGKNEMD